MNKKVGMLLPKKELIQVEKGKLIIIVRISIYLLTTSHTHLLLTTPTTHTHRFYPLSKIFIHTSAQQYSMCWSMDDNFGEWVEYMGVASGRS